MAQLSNVVAARIGSDDVSLAELLHTLKVTGRLGFVNDGIAELLLARAARQEGVTVSDEELQSAADEFRQRQRLFKADETRRWLDANHWTVDDFEQNLEQQLLKRKMMSRLATDEQVERHFAEHRRAYDRAALAQIVVQDEGAAQELKTQIVEEGADFAALARKHSIDERSRDSGGELGTVLRTDLSPAFESAVFGARDGDVVGPVKTDRGYHIVKVHRLLLGQLDENIAAAIRNDLYGQWIEQQFRTANVQIPLFETI